MPKPKTAMTAKPRSTSVCWLVKASSTSCWLIASTPMFQWKVCLRISGKGFAGRWIPSTKSATPNPPDDWGLAPALPASQLWARQIAHVFQFFAARGSNSVITGTSSQFQLSTIVLKGKVAVHGSNVEISEASRPHTTTRVVRIARRLDCRRNNIF